MKTAFLLFHSVIKLRYHPYKQLLSDGYWRCHLFCVEGRNSKQGKMESSLLYALVDTVWKKQNNCQKAVSDVDIVFLHTNRIQDLTASRRLIVIPRMQHIWHVHNQCKFPIVTIILIQQRKLCPNFLGSPEFLHEKQTSQASFNQHSKSFLYSFERDNAMMLIYLLPSTFSFRFAFLISSKSKVPRRW